MIRNFTHALHGAVLLSSLIVAPAATAVASVPDVQSRLGSIAVPFIANAGQLPATVRFQADTVAGALRVMDDGSMQYILNSSARPGSRNAAPTAPAATFVESIVGRGASPRAGERSPTNVSVLRGPAERHLPHVATYEDVRLDGAFPGVDLVLRAAGRNVEKIFTVAPGRDPNAIRMRIDGAKSLRVDAAGALVVGLDGGDMSFTPPVAYQESAAGVREPVAVAYNLAAGAPEYGFTIGPYDTKRALTVDPLIQTTFLGGNAFDGIDGILIHPTSGEVYVAVGTNSNDLLCTTTATAGCQNGAQTNFSGVGDCYVARLNASLTTLLQATYLGGVASDDCRAGIALAPDGLSVYVGGTTQNTIPPVGGGAQSARIGGNFASGYVARVTASLQSLLAYSYFGGSTDDRGLGLAVSPATGDVFLSGYSDSAANLPGIGAGSIQQTLSGPRDLFVARFSPGLGTVQSTYFGGTGTEEFGSIAIHPVSGELYLAGATNSPTIPQLAKGAVTTYAAGAVAAFVARFAPDLSSLRQSTLFGADNVTSPYGIAFNPATSDVYLGGISSSTTLPASSSGAQPAIGGSQDGFVAWFDASLKILYRSTYYGATGDTSGRVLALHPVSHELYLGGDTSSINLPGMSNSIQGTASAGGALEGFVARFSTDLSLLTKATYFGGTALDGISGLVIHPVSGNLYASGIAYSTTLPGTTGGAQPAHAADSGKYDGFIAQMTADLTFSGTNPAPFAFAAKSGVTPASLQISSPAQITGISDPTNIYVDGALGAAYCVSMANGCTCDQSGGGFTSTPGTVVNNRFVCIRHYAPAAAGTVNQSRLHVGAQAATFYVATGAPLGNCSLDVDDNGSADALTDGLMMLRALFGLTGTAVTNNAIGASANRGDWPSIRTFLNGNCGTNFAP